MKISPFLEHLVSVIQQETQLPVVFRHIRPEHGGSINEAYRIETSIGVFFLKTNDAKLHPGMFSAEAFNLQMIRKAGNLHLPEMIAHGEFADKQYLILRFIEKGIPKKEFWEDFGRALALTHKHSAPNYGWEKNNYIGSLVQVNQQSMNWPDFFVHHRLHPMASKALDDKKLNRHHFDGFELLFKKMNELFPNDTPALLHGDLWSGNFMADPDGHPVVFDPASYYGHREMDIAMTYLFGGFHSRFYAAYEETYALEKGWKERIKLANLYPLLVHINLFGGNYVNEVEATLKSYGV